MADGDANTIRLKFFEISNINNESSPLVNDVLNPTPWMKLLSSSFMQGPLNMALA